MVFEHKSDVGRLREENQDSCDAFCIGDTFFGVVADGMGGYKGGSIASSIAVGAVRQRIEAEYDEQMRESELLSLLQSCFVSANSDILQRSIKDAELSGMGTTMVLAAVRQGPRAGAQCRRQPCIFCERRRNTPAYKGSVLCTAPC